MKFMQSGVLLTAWKEEDVEGNVLERLQKALAQEFGLLPGAFSIRELSKKIVLSVKFSSDVDACRAERWIAASFDV